MSAPDPHSKHYSVYTSTVLRARLGDCCPRRRHCTSGLRGSKRRLAEAGTRGYSTWNDTSRDTIARTITSTRTPRDDRVSLSLPLSQHQIQVATPYSVLKRDSAITDLSLSSPLRPDINYYLLRNYYAAGAQIGKRKFLPPLRTT